MLEINGIQKYELKINGEMFLTKNSKCLCSSNNQDKQSKTFLFPSE
jgi:hypothetical protein